MENIKDKKEFIKEHIALSINTKKEILGNSKLIQDIFHVSQSCLKAYQNGKKIVDWKKNYSCWQWWKCS